MFSNIFSLKAKVLSEVWSKIGKKTYSADTIYHIYDASHLFHEIGQLKSIQRSYIVLS